MRTLTGVGAFLCASHRDEAGEIHGHTWEFVAWRADFPEAVSFQARLVEVLAPLCHTVLPDGLASAEALGAYVGSRMVGCIAVDVSRGPERFFARWEA